MQIQILKPSKDGKYYPNYDEMIKNSWDDGERDYLIDVKNREEEWKEKGYKDFCGFAFGIIYVTKMACGHHEIFQHPIYRKYGCDPTESDIIASVNDVMDTIKETKGRKCTRCICGW